MLGSSSLEFYYSIKIFCSRKKVMATRKISWLLSLHIIRFCFHNSFSFDPQITERFKDFFHFFRCKKKPSQFSSSFCLARARGNVAFGKCFFPLAFLSFQLEFRFRIKGKNSCEERSLHENVMRVKQKTLCRCFELCKTKH